MRHVFFLIMMISSHNSLKQINELHVNHNRFFQVNQVCMDWYLINKKNNFWKKVLNFLSCDKQINWL